MSLSRLPCVAADSNLAAAQASTCFRPSLNFECESGVLSPRGEQEEDPVFKYVSYRPVSTGKSLNPVAMSVTMQLPCTVALLALGDKEWAADGMWMLTTKEEGELIRKMGGSIDLKEFEEFHNSAANAEWFSKLPSSARGLQCRSLVQGAFEQFDFDKDDSLDPAEWHCFLMYISQLRLRYLQELAFQGYRAYWGRNQSQPSYQNKSKLSDDTQYLMGKYMEETQTYTASQRSGKCGLCCFGGCFQVGLLVDDWRGWWADLFYYSCNFHPLHGIFSCDANNRLERIDRVFMELSTIAFCLWTAHERNHRSDTHTFLDDIEHDERIYSIVAITLPGYVIWYTLFFLFTMPLPCAVADESVDDRAKVQCARTIASIGDAVGIFAVIVMLVFAGYRLLFHLSVDPLDKKMFLQILIGRLLSYGLSWFLMVAVYFNPFVLWGSTDPLKTSCLTCLADLIALGQWTAEKQKVLITCSRILSKRTTESREALLQQSR